MSTMKDTVRIERLLNRTYKASIGQAQGTGKTESEARRNCEAAAVDILMNSQSPRIETRDGYLIVSQVESSASGWYTIKNLAALQTVNDIHFPLCGMSAKGLKQAIDSHLEQYKSDALIERTS